MNILIIGAGGFIGSHLSEEIIRNHDDWNIVALDIASSKIEHLLNHKRFNFIKADILKDLDVVEEQLKSCDLVFPLAAIANPSMYVQDPLKIFEVDFEGNLQIIKWAVKHNKRIIFPSTSEVYGMCEDEEFDEETSNLIAGPIGKQRWIYSCSKQMLDRVIYAHGLKNGLRYTLFRPFNWIGPRLDDIFKAESGSSRVVSQFLSNILHGKDINLVDGGSQLRCFTYISDGVAALIKIIENKNNCADGQIFNVGNPHNELTIRELAEKIIRFAGKYDKLMEVAKKIKITSMSSADYYGKTYQDVIKRVPSIKKAETALNWKPIVGVNELLTKTMDFYFR
ncbi:MAG: bifunctional UDP-4-keto-pentose/UDP-xylose synthase [Holosporaceae bacterium]|jgi:nucleoside-diphosphate-sugar epimerase|nr:bifunctional UDP-4-keto-pentose/UDP-xylose synthase [Holosporaceae bacterium]